MRSLRPRKSGGGSVGGASSLDTHLDGSLKRLDLPVDHLHATVAAFPIGTAASPSAAFAAITTHDVYRASPRVARPRRQMRETTEG